MIYLNSIPVQVWQKRPGGWVSFMFNASVVSDIAKYDGSRRVSVTFGNAAQEQGYTPRLNDIMVPVADMDLNAQPVSFQGWITRPNQPYYYKGINQSWYERPGLMFLSAYNDGEVYEFSDLFSLALTDLAASGTRFLWEQLEIATVNVWNRITPGHPFLLPATRDFVHFDLNDPNAAKVTYDGITTVTLSDLAQQHALSLGFNRVGGTMIALNTTNIIITWLSTMEEYPATIDLRREDIRQMEVRSRDMKDSPNLFFTYQKDGGHAQQTYYYNQNGDLVHSNALPALNDVYGWRSAFTEVEDTTDIGAGMAKAREALTSSPYSPMVDISIVLDMNNRYTVSEAQDVLTSWSMPVPGDSVTVFGYYDTPIKLPVREYDFASGLMLLGTNDDITLEGGH